jgi:hypothetical protein
MAFRSPPPHRHSAGTPVKARPAASKYKPHQGKREKRRQVARMAAKAKGAA